MPLLGMSFVQLTKAPIGHREKIIPRWSGDKLPHKYVLV